MALIGKIRKNSWLLIIVIGFALAAFIIMDMNTSSSLGVGSEFTVGEVNGEKISWDEFQRTESVLYNNSEAEIYGRRSFLWNYFVEDAIVQQNAAELGLSVTDEEMQELQFGTKLSPIVQRNFKNQQTGQIDRASLDEFKRQLESGQMTPQFQSFWDVQAKEIKKDRLQSKMVNMVKKAIYTPTWMAEEAQKDMGSSITFAYVKVPFDQIKDDEVSLTDDDYKAYLDKNQALFKVNEEIRTVDYLKFDVIPTETDSQDLKNSMMELMTQFSNAENDSTFVENNYGIYDVVYFKKDAVAPNIADTVFSAAPGTVYGPYVEEGYYKAVKVLDRKVIADSVKARHILVRVDPATATQAIVIAANAKMDSIKTLIQSGAESFDSLAIKVSEDLGSGAKGGDLGYAASGMMVKPFNDMLFYQGEPGELNLVYSQFGIHLVEIMDRKYESNEQGVQLAYISDPIVPSENTQEATYDQVLDIVAKSRTIEDLKTAADADDKMTFETAEGLQKNGYIFSAMGAGETSREIIKWSFDPSVKAGDVAPEVFIYEDAELYFNSTYVIPALRSISKPGVPSVADVKNTIKTAVMNRKKGEMIASQITNTDLSAIASNYESKVDTVRNVNFNMSYLQALGQEPEVLANIDAMQVNDVKGPIVGNNAVYVFKVLNKSQASLPSDIKTLRNNVAQPVRNAVDFQLMDALKKAAKIEDNRFTYF